VFAILIDLKLDASTENEKFIASLFYKLLQKGILKFLSQSEAIHHPHLNSGEGTASTPVKKKFFC